MRHFAPNPRERHRLHLRRPSPYSEAMERAQRRAAIIRPLASLPTPPVAASAEAVAGLGRLAVLPNEGVMIVLQHCSLQTLSRARLVNKAFDLMVRLLPDYRYVVHTVGGIMRRARPNYRVVMAKLEAILTFKGLRHLLLSHTCEKCGQGGGSFRLVKVKVLCDECVRGPRHELRVVR